jgi:GTPase SAR1 family protein
MIGHEGVGKTTYMSSMYRQMATEGLSGFWVRARNDADHRRLLSAADGVARAHYPPPSDHRSAYPLTLRYEGSSLIDFAWSDYRGGVLRESGNGQVDEFVTDALGADAVLVFVDSGDLIGRRAVARARVRDLTNIVFQVIDGRAATVPVVLVVTKSDLLDDREDFPIDHLENFIVAVQGNETVIGTIVPTVCGPEPRNILIPVLFTLYFGLHARAAELQARVEFALGAADHWSKNGGAWNRIKAKVKGEPNNIVLAGMARAAAAEEYRSLEPLLEPTQALQYMLSEIQVF